jgi:hypothetical protein
MDHVINYLHDRKYIVVNISASITNHNDIVDRIKQSVTNLGPHMKSKVVLYIESNDSTKDILNKFCQGIHCDCLLIFNGETASIQLSKPKKTINRQIESLLNTKLGCEICLGKTDCVKCGDCCYSMCVECICKLCDLDKKANCPKCRTAKLCDPRIHCDKCNKNWLGNPIVCGKCDRVLCWSCVFNDANISFLTFKDDTEGLDYKCTKCNTQNLLVREPKGQIEKKIGLFV